MKRIGAFSLLVLVAGCARIPVYRAENPFPAVRKIAVAPFFNLSDQPHVDGRAVAKAYYSELQKIPGFEAIPVGVVEAAMHQSGITLSGDEEVRRLADFLQADVLVVGAVTDYSPYYPPRLGLQIEWYAADPESGFIPVFAGANRPSTDFAPPDAGRPTPGSEQGAESGVVQVDGGLEAAEHPLPEPEAPENTTQAKTQSPFAPPSPPRPFPANAAPAPLPVPTDGTMPPPAAPAGIPVIRYTRMFDGASAEFTHALGDYLAVREDDRFGGWRGHLQRSDDFIRFACRRALLEQLWPYGGVAQTQVVSWWHKRR